MDKVKRDELKIEYCPTKEMIADFYTKPLQGSQFIMFRDFIMNVDSAITNVQNHRSVLDDVCSSEVSDVIKPNEWKEVMSKRQRKRMKKAKQSDDRSKKFGVKVASKMNATLSSFYE